MLRSIEHLYRIIDRAGNSGALPEPDLKRARACLDLVQAEHHAELSRLLLDRDSERAAREMAERKTERLRQQIETWRAAAEQAWAEIEARVTRAVDRRPVLQLISRRGPPLRRGGSRGADGAGDREDPSPFFWPKIRLYGSAQTVFRDRLARLGVSDRLRHRPAFVAKGFTFR